MPKEPTFGLKRHSLDCSSTAHTRSEASLRLAVALGVVAGFAAVGFLAYQAERNDPPDWAPPPPTPESPAETVVRIIGTRPSWDVEEMVKRSDAVVIGMISRDLGTLELAAKS